MKNVFIIFFITLLFSSCAGVQFYSDKTIKNENKTGIKFYTPKPYLLVEINNDTIVRSEIIYLPDLVNPVYMKMNKGFGKSELELVFENGMITSYGYKADSQLPETIEAIAKITEPFSNAINSLKENRIMSNEADANGQTSSKLYEIIMTTEGTKLKEVDFLK